MENSGKTEILLKDGENVGKTEILLKYMEIGKDRKCYKTEEILL